MRRSPAAPLRAMASSDPGRPRRRMRSWPIRAILALAWLALVAPGRADATPFTLYTNTGGPASVDDPLMPITDTTMFADQFFTFGSQSVFGSLELSLLDVTNLADLQVELYDNTFNATNQTDEPGNRIASFRPDSQAGDLYEFVLTSQPWLDADASYWIVATAKSPSASAVWTWTTLNPTGDDPLNPGRQLDQSQLWAINGGGGWAVSSGGPYQMQIVVTAVPEPSTWAMGATGLAFASVEAGRRRARRRPLGPIQNRGVRDRGSAEGTGTAPQSASAGTSRS